MTRGRYVAPLALSLALCAGTAQAQEEMPPPAPAAQPAMETSRDARAVEILVAAREALEQTKTISLTSSSEIIASSGPLQAFKLGAEGALWAKRNENGEWVRSMVGQADEIGTSEQVSFAVVRNGQDASWVDHKKQEVVHATGRHARGPVLGTADLLGVHYFLDRPYANELNAPKIEHLGTENVEGTLCDVVRVEYGGRSLPMRWYIAAEDRFPRKIVEELMADATRVYEFTQVQLDSEIDPKRFEIEAPSTYLVVELPPKRDTTAGPEQAEPIVSTPDDPIGAIYGSDVGDKGAPVTGEDIFGNTYNTEDYLGKPLVLFFWASWMPMTNPTVDDIIAIHDHLGENGKLVSMAIRERQPESASTVLLDKGRDDIPVVTSSGRASGAYNIAHVPVVIVLDAEGTIVYRTEEYTPGETVKEIIAKLDALMGG